MELHHPGAGSLIPAVANGVVYFGSADYKLYALDAFTGTKLWSYTTGFLVYSSPAVANGVVYVGSSDRKLYALGARTGALLWTYTTGQSDYGIQSSPTVADGNVYVGAFDGKVYAFGLERANSAKRVLPREPKTLHPNFKLKASKPV